MKVEFGDAKLERLAFEPKFYGDVSIDLAKAYRKQLARIQAAEDERDLYALKSLNYEKLKGGRDGQRSIRLNDQWRLILEVFGDGAAKVVRVIEIVDYH
ncbi:MAG: type II toxin-antitoxin system RelE/ParE family toxin [Planctomycetes bacterium]|nr:type II toxin-antitoxin system RelE/ParE family toxin [Planctomycetota bacterium]